LKSKNSNRTKTDEKRVHTSYLVLNSRIREYCESTEELDDINEAYLKFKHFYVLTVVIAVPHHEDGFIVCEDLLELFLIEREGLTQHLKPLMQGANPADRYYSIARDVKSYIKEGACWARGPAFVIGRQRGGRPLLMIISDYNN
jgi:hypothetical protein